MRKAPSTGIRFSLQNQVGHIVLARPDRDNRFDPEMAAAFAEACERCEDDDCRVVLLTAEGRSFCRGIEGPLTRWPCRRAADFVAALAGVTRPVVASIRGSAEAEGFELALAADLRVVGRSTRMWMSQVARSTIPVFGGTQRLPRVVGAERALRLILLGEAISSREAVDLGLAGSLSSRPDVAAGRMARSLAARGPVAMRFAKEAVRRARDLALDDGARFEHDLYALLQTTTDRSEGIRSFLDKRRPKFHGR